MLGERGMWMKDCFYEPSVRVPLFICAPGVAAGRSDAVVSLVDLMPTFLDFAGRRCRCSRGRMAPACCPCCTDSQKRRLYLRDLTETVPRYDTWAVEIRQGDKDRYVRGRQASFHRKALQRFPFVATPPIEFDPEDETLKP